MRKCVLGWFLKNLSVPSPSAGSSWLRCSRFEESHPEVPHSLQYHGGRVWPRPIQSARLAKQIWVHGKARALLRLVLEPTFDLTKSIGIPPSLAAPISATNDSTRRSFSSFENLLAGVPLKLVLTKSSDSTSRSKRWISGAAAHR